MCGVVTYGRLKTLESAKKVVVSAKGRWSFMRASIFGVLERWLLLGDGCLGEVLTRGGPTPV